MTVFFMILKVIGIVLLTILGILGVLILVILFLPVRYKAEILFPGSGYPQAAVYIHYLMHLFGFHFTYREGKIEAVLRIFCLKKPMFCEQDKEDEENKEESEKKNAGHAQNTSKRKQVPGFFRAFSAMVRELQKAENKEAFQLLIRQAKNLCRHFGPRRLRGELLFCLGDPSYTGITLGVTSLFPIVYRNEFQISPDFESDKIYANGKASLSGRIRLIHGLFSFIRIFRNKTIRKLILKGGHSNVRK